MRLFVAVFPPLAIQTAALAAARAATRRPSGQHPGDRVRWSRPENVHLTLKFLGDVREETLDNLRTTLGEACAGHRSFNVDLIGFGAFPSTRRTRILWAGVGAGSEELRFLAGEIDSALAPLGFGQEERSYTPHLTLGRIRGRPTSLDFLPETLQLTFPARRVELVESTLTERGAIYETIEAFPLEN